MPDPENHYPENHSTTIAYCLAGLLLGLSLYVAYERTGLLPWVGAGFGIAGLIVTALASKKAALSFSVVSVFIVIASWGGSAWFVFSTWESGEVVEIQFEPETSIRTWVIDANGEEIVLYDAPPENIALLEAISQVTVTRGRETYQADIRAEQEGMDSPALAQIFGLYEEKYAAQSTATNVYYVTIGPKRNSKFYLLYLTRRGEE